VVSVHEVAVVELEQQVVGGDVGAGDGEVLDVADDDLEVAVQRREVVGREEGETTGAGEEGVHGVGAVSRVIVDHPLVPVGHKRVSREDALCQEEASDRSAGRTGLVNHVSLP